MAKKSIGHASTNQYTKQELIKLINEAFPDDDGGSICIITTIIDKDYDNPQHKTHYTQGVVFNGILGYKEG